MAGYRSLSSSPLLQRRLLQAAAVISSSISVLRCECAPRLRPLLDCQHLSPLTQPWLSPRSPGKSHRLTITVKLIRVSSGGCAARLLAHLQEDASGGALWPWRVQMYVVVVVDSLNLCAYSNWNTLRHGQWDVRSPSRTSWRHAHPATCQLRVHQLVHHQRA